jgi:histidinol dehydrogenase
MFQFLIGRLATYDISKSAIHRVYKDYREAAKEYAKKFDEIKALLISLKDRPVTEMMEAVSAIIARHIIDFVKNIESIDFDDPESLVKVTKAVSQISESLQKVREERLQRAVEEVEKNSKQEFSKQEVLKILKEAYGG